MGVDIANIIQSLKGISGTGGTLGQVVKSMNDFLMTLEPGDTVRDNPPITTTAPIASDLWYLYYNQNLMEEYYTLSDEEADHYNYRPYIDTNLSFLALLGVEPLKVLRDLEQLTTDISENVFHEFYSASYENNGIYWINTIAFELWKTGQGFQYPSPGPANFRDTPQSINDYVGYISFPIGQLGVQEVISLVQETDLNGYEFANADDDYSTYHEKPPIVYSELEEKFKPSIQITYEIFPNMKDENDNALAGMNYCFGRHIVESAYIVPNVPIPSQNALNSSGSTAYAPTPKLDVELFSLPMDQYGEDVRPKFWMRYWIHKDSTLPVPGEFIGILCRPVACPPHLWWFQESSPFLYAGNWMETGNLTSGVITTVILEEDRTDEGTGNQYYVKVQGCEIIIDSSDFLSYSVGDRVAVIKVDSTETIAANSHTWLDQSTLKDTDLLTNKTNFIIIPCTYYKIKT